MFLKSLRQYRAIVLIGILLGGTAQSGAAQNVTAQIGTAQIGTAQSTHFQVCLLGMKKAANLNWTPFSLSNLLQAEDDFISMEIPLTAQNVERAYEVGVFPWACSESRIDKVGAWFFPIERWVLFLDKLHIPRRLQQHIRNHPEYSVTFDTSFLKVMEGCAKSDARIAVGEGDKKEWQSRIDHAWISPQFFKVWSELFSQGKAHSVEVWKEGKLVAGLYGTFIRGVFFAESAFGLERETIKIAFVKLAERLRANGHTFIDLQDPSDWTERLGASLITKETFSKLLSEQQKKNLSF